MLERRYQTSMANEDKPVTLSRRAVIASAALVPVAAIKSAAQTAAPPAPSIFTAAEIRILEAFIGRLIPNDDNGPGAVECGAVRYFEGQLAGDLASEKARILEGLAAVDGFARRAHGAAFPELAPDKQDAVLSALQNDEAAGFAGSAGFFTRMRRLTLEGTFGDPYYGGNKGFAGWDLIRYPGVRLAVAPEDQKMTPVKPAHTSAWGAKSGH